MKKNFFCAILAVVVLVLSGCAGRYVSMRTEGPQIYAVGDVAVISQKTTTTVVRDSNGLVTGTMTVTEAIQSVKTESAADLELNLRKEDRKENVGVAQAGQVKVISRHHDGGYGHNSGWSTRGDIMLPGRNGSHVIYGGSVTPR